MVAINANVEAARLGSDGAGFAVVARKVKDLSIESEKHARAIRAQANGMRERTEGTVHAMIGIADVIDQLDDISSGIAKTMASQKSDVDSIEGLVREATRSAAEMNAAVSRVAGMLAAIGGSINDVYSEFNRLIDEDEGESSAWLPA